MKSIENAKDNEIFEDNSAPAFYRKKYAPIREKYGYDNLKTHQEVEKAWKNLFNEWRSKGYDKLSTQEANKKWQEEGYKDRHEALKNLFFDRFNELKK